MSMAATEGWSRICTDEIAPHDRLDFWHHATNSLFPPTKVRRSSHSDFYGQITWKTFGEVTLADIVSTTLEVSRTEEQINASDHWYEINLQIEGSSFFNQSGRDVLANPRSIVLYDSRLPYRMEFDGPYRQLSLKVPRAALRDRVPGIDMLTARAISAETLPGRFFFDFAVALCDIKEDDGTQPFRARIEGHVIELLATALLGNAEPTPLSAGRQAQLGRIKSFILANLDNPDLAPADIARAQQISLRSLYELFASEENQVAQWIKLQRLERIRADLSDPLLRGWPITTVALRRGFKDFSHFSRVFRGHFGISPRDFRKSQLH